MIHEKAAKALCKRHVKATICLYIKIRLCINMLTSFIFVIYPKINTSTCM